jgi:phosphatidylinositol alpha-1,6-mannosyltransferase
MATGVGSMSGVDRLLRPEGAGLGLRSPALGSVRRLASARVRRHLLVTNDFPPKIGGIQTYLEELWRRLPVGSYAVATITQPGSDAFDRQFPAPIYRLSVPMLLPTASTLSWLRQLTARERPDLVVFDPALPIGRAGPKLGLPYAVVLHGAEIGVPARLPGLRRLLGEVLAGAELVIAAGSYVAGEAGRCLGRALPPVVVVPPGIDQARFCPADPTARTGLRRAHGLDPDGLLVLAVSRLVPRKGIDRLICAAGALRSDYPHLEVVVAGTGRDGPRLRRLAVRRRARVRFLGRVSPADLPAVYRAADLFALPCRSRWGGLEQEGFGIVFLEAAASGLPAIGGQTGGVAEAIVDGRTGWVVEEPASSRAVEAVLRRAVADRGRLAEVGRAARDHAERFDYDRLAVRLAAALDRVPLGTGSSPAGSGLG